ncbi:MAG: hypothetical protein JJ896_02955 [Rhodothermales bacterium]|nr:hypothetical protein [Rhodothermales bacterium]MBO6778591.1 hypothetical protein [Rhodothermales bacterium]
MQVVKYFHEEPASLEILATDLSAEARQPDMRQSLEQFLRGPRYYRGYLAGTDLEADRTGATTVASAWIPSLVTLLASDHVYRERAGSLDQVDTGHALAAGLQGDVLTAGLRPHEPLSPGPVRERLPSLRPRLDGGGIVLIAEPAHDGVDWALFSPAPQADRLRTLFSTAASGPARFVIPHVEARGEHKFYFERYDLELYAHYRT